MEWTHKKRTIRSEWRDVEGYAGLHVTRVAVLCQKDGKVCLVRSAGGNKWVFPGGKPEKDETLENAARREVSEEASLKIKNLILVGATENFVKDNPKEGDHFFHLFFYSDIEEVQEPTDDPDLGRSRERIFVNPEDLQEYNNWGEMNKEFKARIYQLSLASEEDNR